MPSPHPTPPPSPARPSACRWLRLGVVVAVLALVAARWDARTGFTALLRFGDAFAERRVPAVAALPLESVPGLGYDGQFYAQFAVDPRVLRPEVRAAFDVPAYRAQRLFLPLLAHTAGRPWWILQTYALLNAVAWLLLAHFWWSEITALAPRRAPWLWLAGVLSLGALDSVRLALVDLPAALLLLLGVRATRTTKPGRAAVFLALAGLTRETALFGAFAITHATFWKRWGLRALGALPAVAWFVWLRVNLPAGVGGFAGNFAWPGAALAAHLARCVWELAQGNFDSRYVWGLIGATGFIYQSLHLIFLARRRWAEPWVRASVPFAVLFWVLGDSVWAGYWAVARASLPLTLAFNLTLPAGRGFWWRFVLGNACLLHAVYRFLPPF
ncbi:MAG TPA: hypothetical protein VK178_01435 [Opitutaceae bacterium]|nr:hypothetical protein [Opitutaceae bacterium]